MIIKELKTLNKNIIDEIRLVEAKCKEYDNSKMDIYLDNEFNFNKDIKSIFLMYENEKLISLLSMFIPTREEAEISAYTLPSYRGKGCFKHLFNAAIDELKKYKINDILLTCESSYKIGSEIINKLGGKYDFSEYVMRLNVEKFSFDKNKCLSKLCIPVIEDVEILTDISQKTFKENYEDAKSMLKNTFESKDRKQYALKLENEFVGIGSTSFDGTETSIYGLGILPKYQGRGLGKELLLWILNDLIQKGKKNITLEVDSSNKKAFNLYKKNCFEVEIAIDYYRMKLRNCYPVT